MVQILTHRKAKIMSPASHQPAANETIDDFVSLLFQRLIYQDNLEVVEASWAQDVAEDVYISINGTILLGAKYLELVKGFHATAAAKLQKKEMLVVAPGKDDGGRTGTVSSSAQVLVMHKDGKVVDQSSVLIVQVGEKDGRRIMTSLVEVTLEKTRA
ncbi:hypothetical protein FB45DRAFT_160639 [Roridomyces roridus]|uniref:SnoaL-like domain-containing protein n=1 Tax=Roridomyces roridus TaxID=1738132 RepID=A0AAD7BG07_9AGAR|nr:hypothetical protein FB45DRAFT_160639 [Roridomyces roridus]